MGGQNNQNGGKNSLNNEDLNENLLTFGGSHRGSLLTSEDIISDFGPVLLTTSVGK